MVKYKIKWRSQYKGTYSYKIWWKAIRSWTLLNVRNRRVIAGSPKDSILLNESTDSWVLMWEKYPTKKLTISPTGEPLYFCNIIQEEYQHFSIYCLQISKNFLLYINPVMTQLKQYRVFPKKSKILLWAILHSILKQKVPINMCNKFCGYRDTLCSMMFKMCTSCIRSTSNGLPKTF